MILPDVNVLIYAFRKDMPHHASCRAWLRKVITGEARFGLSPLTLAAVTRITTNSRTFRMPSATDEVFAFCDNLREQTHVQLVTPGERHWDIFKRLCVETGTKGPQVSDAWFAALAIEWDCEWITFDRDFARFPGLRFQTPTVIADLR